MVTIQDDIDRCAHFLSAGGIILYPTDTIWGIGCDATNKEAIDMIFRLKKRDESKSMIVLLNDHEDVFKYVTQLPPQWLETINSFTRPTTIIYPQGKNLASNLIAEDGSVALRIVADPFCKQLIKSFGKPIVSTSANVSSTPSPKQYNEISVEIKNGVDYIVNQRREEFMSQQPSAIIRLLADGSQEILR